MATQKEIILSLKTTFDGTALSRAARDLDSAAASTALADAALAGLDSAGLKAMRTASDLALAQQRAAESSNTLAKAAQGVAAAYATINDPATRGVAANNAYAASLKDAANSSRQFRTDMDALAAARLRDVQLADQQVAAAERAAAASKKAADAQFASQLKTFNGTALGATAVGAAERGGFGRAANAVAQNFAYSGVPGAGLAFGLPAAAVGGIAVAGAGIYAIQQASGLDNRVRQLIGGTTGDSSQVNAYKQGLLAFCMSASGEMITYGPNGEIWSAAGETVKKPGGNADPVRGLHMVISTIKIITHEGLGGTNMATPTLILTTSERFILRQLSAIVASLDWWSAQAKQLERDLTILPDSPYKRSLLKELLALHQHESQALLDLRDATAHLCSQVVPAVQYAGEG